MSVAKKQAAYMRGLEAEKAAARYLQRKGYNILEQRYKTPGGEIDLIARQGDMIVFAEVKSYKTEEQALYAVNAKTRRRVEAAAGHYIAHHEDISMLAMRFDVLVVSSGAPGSFNLLGAVCVRHLDNAWLAGQ